LESFAGQLDAYTKPVLILTAVSALFLNGLFGPVVEELYFRGFLLPRMACRGRWAPFVHTVLFSLYHFFTPWQNPLRIAALTPMSYAVWWKKNIYIGIIVHCVMNLSGSLMLTLMILKQMG
jgi:membrane protease YdiL (CAAX protease family)